MTTGLDNRDSLLLVSVHVLTACYPQQHVAHGASHGLSCFLIGSEEDEEMPCKRPKTETKQDYEEWKKKILENAAKARETRSTDSVMPPSNVTAACS